MGFMKDIAYQWQKEILSSASGAAIWKGIEKAWDKYTRTNAPSQARDLEAEAAYNLVIGTDSLVRDDQRLALDAFLNQIGRGERYNDMMKSAKDELGDLNDQRFKERAKALAVNLCDIADAPTFEDQLNIAVARGYMKRTEEEYSSVRHRQTVERDILPHLQQMATEARQRAEASRPPRPNPAPNVFGWDPRVTDAQRATWRANTNLGRRILYFFRHPIASLQNW